MRVPALSVILAAIIINIYANNYRLQITGEASKTPIAQISDQGLSETQQVMLEKRNTRLISRQLLTSRQPQISSLSTASQAKAAVPEEIKTESVGPKIKKAAYQLTDKQRDKIERIVMASVGELDNYGMALANAQVIKDRVESGLFGNSLEEILSAPCQFEHPWKGEVNKMVKDAVSSAFDDGKRVTLQRIYYYVNPNYCEISMAKWNSDKKLVITIGSGVWKHQYYTNK